MGCIFDGGNKTFKLSKVEKRKDLVGGERWWDIICAFTSLAIEKGEGRKT